MSIPDIDAAEQFIASHGRILDRRRFERLFRDGEAQPVRDAFGHGLNPDGRSPGSQPATAELALRTLHQADAWSPELALGACDWLQSVVPAEGGAGFVDPSIEGWPHAPWWVPQQGNPASLITTGQIAGTLHARGVTHPWLDRATEVMWHRIDGLTEAGPYDMRGVLRFLDHVPDRSRAERAFGQAGPLLIKLNIVELDPDATGEVHLPLDFAPAPDCLARRLFDDATIEANLDHLARAQREDGGWMFNWPSWSQAAESDWRGSITVDALCTLRAYGHL